MRLEQSINPPRKRDTYFVRKDIVQTTFITRSCVCHLKYLSLCMVKIYTLEDPRNGQIRYVGKTINLEQRLYKPG